MIIIKSVWLIVNICFMYRTALVSHFFSHFNRSLKDVCFLYFVNSCFTPWVYLAPAATILVGENFVCWGFQLVGVGSVRVWCFFSLGLVVWQEHWGFLGGVFLWFFGFSWFVFPGVINISQKAHWFKENLIKVTEVFRLHFIFHWDAPNPKSYFKNFESPSSISLHLQSFTA